MSEFTKALVVSPLSDGRTWVLLDPFSYDVGHEGSGDTINVPVLFKTDFASVPRPFWSIFPPWGRYGNAAVIHDFGYADQSRSRREVDHIFLEGMAVLGVGSPTRYILYFFVRLFGWLAWWGDRRRRQRGESIVAAHLPDKSVDGRREVDVVRPLSRPGELGGHMSFELANVLFSGISAVASAIQVWEFTQDKVKAGLAFDDTYKKTLASPESHEAAKQLVAIIPPDVIKDLEGRADTCWTGYRKVLGGDYLPDEVEKATDSVKGCVCRELRRIDDLNGSIPDRWKGQWNRFKCVERAKGAPVRA